ncbi:MAG: hypothetical protein QOI80_1268 [Solirubrobacteraceae bacterium]|jgi:uncharacterized membrane protein YbaN (DUF454 family)|nr:hypothetical protein [Solirubrobacteraceae bacterium]
MHELGQYERRFRRAGLPLFIEDYSAASDVFTRAAPLLTLVFIGETLGAISFDWSVWANIGAAFGGLAILLGVYMLANRLRGRPPTSRPDRVGGVELALFAIVPGLLPLIFGGQVESGLVTMAVNAVGLWLIWMVVGYALASILRGALGRLGQELAGSVATLARAVPLLMLFAAVLFLSTELWQVFSTVPAPFLAALGVLVVCFGLLFLIAQLPDEVRRMEADFSAGHPLTRRQRVNVALIMLVSHALQVLVVTAAMAAAFVLFGALAIGPSVYRSWIGHDGDVLLRIHVFGETARVTTELLRVTGAVAGLSGLYYAIAVLTDATYRDQFLDRLSSDMRAVFADRARYLEERAGRERVTV